jgi:hypothetical protein
MGIARFTHPAAGFALRLLRYQLPGRGRPCYSLVWWFRSSLQFCRETFKRTSEPEATPES